MISKKIAVRILLFFSSLSSSMAVALPEKCIQAPSRAEVCPHLLYKKSALDVAVIGVRKGEVICICLSDLNAFRAKNLSRVAEIEQHVTLERISAEYKISKQDILTLVSH